jgi:hypothetical protein
MSHLVLGADFEHLAGAFVSAETVPPIGSGGHRQQPIEPAKEKPQRQDDRVLLLSG